MYYREGTGSNADSSDDEVVLHQKKKSSAGAGAGVAAAAADGSDAGESPSADVASTNAIATAASTSQSEGKAPPAWMLAKVPWLSEYTNLTAAGTPATARENDDDEDETWEGGHGYEEMNIDEEPTKCFGCIFKAVYPRDAGAEPLSESCVNCEKSYCFSCLNGDDHSNVCEEYKHHIGFCDGTKDCLPQPGLDNTEICGACGKMLKIYGVDRNAISIITGAGGASDGSAGDALAGASTATLASASAVTTAAEGAATLAPASAEEYFF